MLKEYGAYDIINSENWNLSNRFAQSKNLRSTIEPVILSERQRVEESTHFGSCNANIWWEDPSAPFHSAQDDKTKDSTNSMRRADASDRIG